jgi:hypothetical protein
MNIEKIKSEFERLSQIISAWNDNESVAAIERDLALDKLLKIYDLVRFAECECEKENAAEVAAPVAAPIVAPAVEPEPVIEENKAEESDVEVEFIFADDQEEFEVVDSAEEAEQSQSAGEILSATVASFIAAEKSEPEPVVAPEPEPVVEPEPIVIPEPVAEPEPTPEPVVVEVAPQPESEPAPAPAPKPARPMNNLFGTEEPRRQPRNKHQRMMSIYNDNESRPEKVVDISKIFDLEADEPAPAAKPAAPAPKSAPTPRPAAPRHEEPKQSATAPIDMEPATTLGDVMAQNTQTLADTIAAPTALGEEISHQGIRSLRQGIGLNDKFLMIRDLFDGDADAYNETIDALDSFDDFDDCLIYIAENFAWNADSEGAKFIMQLLERKLS